MKIAIYHNLPVGGAKRALYEEMKFLTRRHDLYLYEINNQDNFLKVHRFAKRRYFYPFSINNSLPNIFNRIYSDFNNFILLKLHHKKIAYEIDIHNYDLCLVHPDSYTQAPFLLRYLKTPSIYFCEEYLRICYENHLKFDNDVIFYKRYYENITRLIRKNIDKNNARLSTKVVANSAFTKKNIDIAYDINSKICHLGVDVEVFKRVSKKTSNYVIVIGEKNIVDGYDLLKNISDRIIKFGMKVKTLGSSSGDLAIKEDNVLADRYSKAITTLCISHNEPFGLAAIESMACETPVLAVNEGGYRETVVDGVTGYLLPRDPKVFAEKIKFLIDNPDIARRMGKAGREHVKKNFTWEKHNKKLEKILLKYAKKKGKKVAKS